jgi:hypothetical protein
MLRMVFVIAAATILAVACAQEPDLHLDFTEKLPPSFSFSGRSTASRFEIQELPRSRPLSKIDPYSLKGEAIWSITASSTMNAANWPMVRYGDVPRGFSQTIPGHGLPPELSEDKLYIAKIIGEQEYESAFFFEVRNSKIVNVTDKAFGP